MAVIPEVMIADLPDNALYSIYEVWTISVITDANCVEYIIVMITARDTYPSSVTSGNHRLMSVIHATRKSCAGRINISIRLSTLTLL